MLYVRQIALFLVPCALAGGSTRSSVSGSLICLTDGVKGVTLVMACAVCEMNCRKRCARATGNAIGYVRKTIC